MTLILRRPYFKKTNNEKEGKKRCTFCCFFFIFFVNNRIKQYKKTIDFLKVINDHRPILCDVVHNSSLCLGLSRRRRRHHLKKIDYLGVNLNKISH